ncbi:MAG: hypothetical protein CVV08_10445 [Gammaproteobacteria bacterium HGW-Gammaproteobacteria-12]|nr:MAG: hypothetical protein CVV08_10445 [Gammaproteobacteria bacterium HGW-Gammaproteobacteria-12]
MLGTGQAGQWRAVSSAGLAVAGGAGARVCSRFVASRVAAKNLARLGGGRREWLFPCQVLQQRMARFCAQPAGPGPF